MAGKGSGIHPLILPDWAERMDATNRVWVRLNDVCAEIVDCPHSTPTLVEHGDFYIARTQDFREGTLDLTEAARVDRDTFSERSKRVTPSHGDLIYSREGAYHGIAAEIPQRAKVCLGQRTVLIRPDTTKANFRFLRYWLNSDRVRSYVAGHRAGSAAPRINLPTIRGVPVALPPLAEQKAIAAVLGALDDKIELNRRTNATLEAMARALFRSWFVDFDPVRAKLNGRNPIGLDSELAALFPTKFQESPIGLVPKGWKVERFDAHITAERGLSYKGEGLRDDGSGLPMHNLNSIYEGGGYKHEGIKFYAGEYREKHLVEPGDMIVTNTEQGFDHLLIGHAAIVPKCYGPKGIYSHHIYRVRHKPASPFSPHYLVELFNNRRWHHWISGFSNGTTINMLPMDALEMPMLVVPPVALVKHFTALAEAAHLQVEDNKQQSRTLATLRDTLLPKLLSGELRASTKQEDYVGR